MVRTSILTMLSATPILVAATTFDPTMVTDVGPPQLMPLSSVVTGFGKPLTEEPKSDLEMFPGALARLEFLRDLDQDHDGEGAAAPSTESFNSAAMFLRFLPFYAPDPTVGVDSDGHAVIEFHDENEFGQVIFRPGRFVEIYHESATNGAVGLTGNLEDVSVRERFREIFKFNIEA